MNLVCLHFLVSVDATNRSATNSPSTNSEKMFTAQPASQQDDLFDGVDRARALLLA
jgi:hypothetical protein